MKKIGVIGFSLPFITLLSQRNDIEIVGFNDVNGHNEAFDQALEMLSFQQMMNKADIVVICDSKNQTCDRLDKIISYGKHILLENRLACVGQRGLYEAFFENACNLELNVSHCELEGVSLEEAIEDFFFCLYENVVPMEKDEFFPPVNKQRSFAALE